MPLNGMVGLSCWVLAPVGLSSRGPAQPQVVFSKYKHAVDEVERQLR